jgi:heptosyltransferase-2
MNNNKKILVWLPSPLGDAVMATPALRAIRKRFPDAHITFYANKTVAQTLSPSTFNDQWITTPAKNLLKLAAEFKKQNFSNAVLFKNSFGSALTCFLAKIKTRTGYARQGRSFFLNDKLCPPRLANGKYKPAPMIDYYLNLAAKLGCDTKNRSLEIQIDEPDKKSITDRFPQITQNENPLIILVPGGSFGPSKCWPAKYFAQLADKLFQTLNAQIVISVSQNQAEKKIAGDIINNTSAPIINLADTSLTLGQLKALFDHASLVVTNDTGPRHIAVALAKNVVTLFGPNDPEWTKNDWQKEISIVASVPCAPCQKAICPLQKRICMESITIDQVFNAAKELLCGK